MNKIRILSALMALLLCLSMLLVACGNKDKNNETDATDATDAVDSNDEKTEESDSEDKAEAEDEEDEEAPKVIFPTIKLADVMNTSWKTEDKKLTAISEAVYAGTVVKGGYKGILVTKEAPKTAEFPLGDKSKMVTHVYNMYTEKHILDVSDSTTRVKNTLGNVTTYTTNYVDIISSEYFAVLSMTRVDANYGSDSVSSSYSEYFEIYLDNFDKDEATDVDYTTYNLTFYDCDGNAVKNFNSADVEKMCEIDEVTSIDNFRSAYERLRNKYVVTHNKNEYLGLTVVDNKVYRYEEALKPSQLIKDFGSAKVPSFDEKIGDIYLDIVDDSSYMFYDKDLNLIYSYTVPSYAVPNYEVPRNDTALANGDYLIQYSVALNDDDVEFDFMRNNAKYDLVTVTINKNGVTEHNDINYIIGYLEASVAGDDGQKIYADNIENVAAIYPIGADKMYDRSDNNVRIVTISNDLKTVKEIIADEKLISMPWQINNENIAVSVIGGGLAIYNENGERQGTVDDNYYNYFVGKYYIVDGDAIYDLKGNKIYDFKKDASTMYDSWVDQYRDIALIYTYDQSNVMKYSIFANGVVTELDCVYADNMGDFYYIEQNEIKNGNNISKYTYYNEDGEKLYEDDEYLSLNYVFECDAFGLYRDINTGKIYKLTYTK